MTISDAVIDQVHRMAEVARAQIKAGIDQAITETVLAGVQHAEIHVFEWSETTGDRFQTKAVVQPLEVDSGGLVICYHPYGTKPEQ